MFLHQKDEVTSPAKAISSCLASSPHHCHILPPLLQPLVLILLLFPASWLYVFDLFQTDSRVSVTVTDASVQQQHRHDLTVIREYHSSQFHKDKRSSPEIYMLGTGDVFVVILSCHAWLTKRFLVVNQDTPPIKWRLWHYCLFLLHVSALAYYLLRA